jgi:DNA-directed RNA polymerase subunit L
MNNLRKERLNMAEVIIGDWNITEAVPSASIPWDFNMTKLKRFEVSFKIRTMEGIKPHKVVVEAANSIVATALAKSMYNREFSIVKGTTKCEELK